MRTGSDAIASPDPSRPGRKPGETAGLRRAYTGVLYLMVGVLAVIALLDPAEYAGLAALVPRGYGELVARLMRFDQLLTLSIALLSLLAAVQRSRGDRHALRWTAVASYAFLAVPSLVGLLPFGYWFLRVRSRERAARPGEARAT